MREKGITSRNSSRLMKIKMAIGCSSATFHGSKFHISIYNEFSCNFFD